MKGFTFCGSWVRPTPHFSSTAENNCHDTKCHLSLHCTVFFVTHWPIKLLFEICACAGAHAINYFVIRWASTICFLIYTLLPFTTKATRQKRNFEMRSRFRFILKSPNIGEIRVFPEHYIFKELFFQLGRTKESIKLSLFYFFTYALLTFNTTKSSRRKKIHRHFWKYHWIKSP